MAAVCQLFVFFMAICVFSGGNGQNSTTTTGMGSDLSHTLTDMAHTESTTPAPIPFICPVYIFSDYHTCRWKCNKRVFVGTDPYCYCDSPCIRYGDCCFDYADFCIDDEKDEALGNPVDQSFEYYNDMHNKTNTSPIPISLALEVDDTVVGTLLDDFTKCVQTTDFDPDSRLPRSGHYLVALCPQGWSGDSAILKLCQEPAGSNTFAAIPVEGRNGRHYRNIYCALCHGLRPGNLTFWSVSYQEKRGGISLPLNASQMLEIAGETRQNPAFVRTFDPPSNSGEQGIVYIRRCAVLDPSPCLTSDVGANDLCNRYTAPIAHNGTTYNNFACLDCVTSPAIQKPLQPYCQTFATVGNSQSQSGGWGKLSMATLLIFFDHTDIDGLSEKESLGSSTCGPNQIYDPFLNFCRDLTCPEGFYLQNGERCSIIHDNTTTQTMSNVQVTLIVRGSFQDEFSTNKYMSGQMWEAVAHKAAKDFEGSFSVCSKKGTDLGDTGQQGKDNKNCDKVNLTWACSVDADIFSQADLCGNGALFTCSVNITINSRTLSTDEIISDQKVLLEKCFVGSFWNHTIQLNYLSISTPCKSLLTEANKNESNDAPISAFKVVYVWDDYSDLFRVSTNDTCVNTNCPLVTLSVNEYSMAGPLNDSIRLTQDGRVLQRGEYNLKDNGDVEVCNFLPSNVSKPAVSPTAGGMWDDAHFILTVSGSSLSLIGLVVTIVTYVVFPTLHRNAAGKSLMCLVVSLFCAQLTMLIGLDRTDIFAVCVTFAIGSHYFWLSAFFWMNVLAIDIYRTFGIGTKINDPNARSFLYYALYGLGVPALIVCACAILSFCDCVEVDVHYASEHACWIGNGMTNLVSFGVPIVVILCSNAVLFSLTVAGIVKTRRASERMNITQGQGGAAAKTRTDLILYLKLSAIMGFTWIFGFVASFSGVQFFWYPFIVLNSLQGAFVCLAFVCNKRTLTMWKARLKGGDGQRSSSNSSNVRRTQQSNQTSMSEMSTTALKHTKV